MNSFFLSPSFCQPPCIRARPVGRLGPPSAAPPQTTKTFPTTNGHKCTPMGEEKMEVSVSIRGVVSHHVRRLERGAIKLDKTTREWLEHSMEGNCNL